MPAGAFTVQPFMDLYNWIDGLIGLKNLHVNTLINRGDYYARTAAITIWGSVT